MGEVVSLNAYRKRIDAERADSLEEAVLLFDNVLVGLHEVGLQLVMIADGCPLSPVGREQLVKAIQKIGDEIGDLSIERERVHVIRLCHETGTEITSRRDLEKWIEDNRVDLPELSGFDLFDG